MTTASALHGFWSARGAQFVDSGCGAAISHFDEVHRECRAARDGAGLVDLSHRTKLELTGADRVRFLHNLCTNDIKALAPGQGCEAFLTTSQGKIVGHVYVFATSTALVLDTVAGQSEGILEHLEKYRITDNVDWIDNTDAWVELYASGPRAAAVLEMVANTPVARGASAVLIPEHVLEHGRGVVGGVDGWLRRVDLCGDPGYQVVVAAGVASQAAAALIEAGAVPIGMRAFDVLRLEAGTPLFGRDITQENLPQEVGRDRQAISFTKGCYLGQETVARIDAHGHVNRHLVGLRCDGDEPPPEGSELRCDGTRVGRVTSAARSERLGVIALAYVRRGKESPGTVLQVHGADPDQTARVNTLPFEPKLDV